MTQAEKRKFVLELIAGIQAQVLRELPDTPEHWDGHELRRLIADHFEDASITLKPPATSRPPHAREHAARWRQYHNDVLINDLLRRG